MPDELEQALENYLNYQEVALSLTAVVQAAVRAYLAERGYLAPSAPLQIRPAVQGSVHTDTSLAHDRLLARGD